MPRSRMNRFANLPVHLQQLAETLAPKVYAIRARQRLERSKDNGKLIAARYPPYEELPNAEKQEYRNAAAEALLAIVDSGYRLDPITASQITETALRSEPGLNLEQIASLNLSAVIAFWQARVPDEWAGMSGIYQAVARRVLKLGEPLVAYDILTEALRNKPADVELRQMLALSLARSGATQRANSILTQLRDEGHRDEETLGILARTHKDLWMHATDRTEARQQLKLAHKFYHEAYKLNRGYYSGINAATLALLIGREDEAKTLAKNGRAACLAELKSLPKASGHRYWPIATLGEAALIARRWSEAEDWYTQAAEIAKGQFADLSSTRRNARILLNHFRRDSTAIERALKIPGIIVFAGHLIDQRERALPRFPAVLEPVVAEAIKTRIKNISPGFGYASAGCGSDILFFEALLERGAEAHVVLPYEKEEFIKDSVSFANSDWVNRFERVLECATSVTTASSERIEEGSMSFEYANLLLFGLADIRARQLEADLVPLAVWDQKPGDGPGGTASAVAQWKHLGLNVQVIDLAKILQRAESSHSERAGVRVRSLADKSKKKKISSPIPGGPHPNSLAKGEGTRQRASLPTRIMAMLFADAVNFSKLTEQQIPLFLSYFLGAIGKLIATSPDAPLIKNTWGDGLYFVFDDVKHAGLFALELCELMVQTNWGKTGLPKGINLRIALHAGPVYACVDPVTEQPSYTGTHVSRAARIEPITPPGQVYASQAFAALAAAHGVKQFTCDYVGQTPLAKGYGTFATYHVRSARTPKR